MAYLAFDDTGFAFAGGPASAGGRTPVADPVPAPVGPVATARFGPLEWAVVLLARRDTLGSLRRPGRLAVAMRAVFRQHNPRLADERLEALRRMAVLSWRHGYTVSSREVATFIAAGFTADQYELLLAAIGAAHARERRR